MATEVKFYVPLWFLLGEEEGDDYLEGDASEESENEGDWGDEREEGGSDVAKDEGTMIYVKRGNECETVEVGSGRRVAYVLRELGVDPKSGARLVHRGSGRTLGSGTLLDPFLEEGAFFDVVR